MKLSIINRRLLKVSIDTRPVYSVQFGLPDIAGSELFYITFDTKNKAGVPIQEVQLTLTREEIDGVTAALDMLYQEAFRNKPKPSKPE